MPTQAVSRTEPLVSPPSPLAVNVQRAAAMVGITRTSLYELMAAGDGPPSFKIGRRRLFLVEELRRWAAERAATTE